GVLETFASPAHPYTKALLRSIPRLDVKGQRLEVIAGLPPVLTDIPVGCSFNPRCGNVQDRCRTERPELATVTPGHASACHYAKEVMNGE
ncbi:oligopeptide/dipeptide ABC transporter ATP-binding protein, partial [Stackebrandtia soli]|uniref:oligopeptide/dipeptide ABC transporter ATP-binding protein n=1 Tax=Stackebrandtia soli TaxID=1892856 RepID=UPI0039E776AC